MAATMLRVLVVDDCDDTAVTMAFLLKSLGHEAVVAHGGEDALQQAPSFKPDAMFIDLAMPVVDGLTVARTLRQTIEFSETPLVAVSGYVDAEHRAMATAAGFTEFLAKPYPLAVLEATLARASLPESTLAMRRLIGCELLRNNRGAWLSDHGRGLMTIGDCVELPRPTLWLKSPLSATYFLWHGGRMPTSCGSGSRISIAGWGRSLSRPPGVLPFTSTRNGISSPT